MEVLTVTIILVILASVAVPAYQSYILRARTAEAPVNLQNIVNGELAFLEKPRINKADGTELRTCWVTSSNRHPYQMNQRPLPQAKGWNAPDAPPAAFNVVGFRPSGSVFYSYSMDNRPNLTDAFDPAVGNVQGYCLDGDAGTHDTDLTTQGLRVRAVADLDGDLSAGGEGDLTNRVGRYARFITMANSIPVAGPLFSSNEYE